MTYEEFLHSLKNHQIAGCYIFYGIEENLKQKSLQALRNCLLPRGLEQMNETLLKNPELDELVAACETLPLGCERRLVVVHDCKALQKKGREEKDAQEEPEESVKKGSGKMTEIYEYIPKLPNSTCLVFYVRGDDFSSVKKLSKTCQKYGSIVFFDKLSDEQLIRMICETVQAKGGKIDRTAAQFLIFTVGKLTSLLEMEIHKLLCYTDEGQPITEKEIAAVCAASPEYTIFQIVDAQVAGKLQDAFRMLDRLYKQGEDSMFVLSMLLRQYRILYHMRCLMEEKVKGNEQAGLLGISPYAVNRTRSQAMRYSKEQLRRAYETMLDIEFRVKQGRLPADNCGEFAILSLHQILSVRSSASPPSA